MAAPETVDDGAGDDGAARANLPFRGWSAAGILVALVAGVLLRACALDATGLVQDEGATWFVAQASGDWFWQLATVVEGNMTLYYVLLRGIVLVFGDSEIALRALPALAGVLSIGALYLLGRRLIGHRGALLGAAFFAVHTAAVSIAREARSYSMLLLFYIVATHALLRAVERPTRTRYWVLYLLAAALALYSHVFALVLLGAPWLLLSREDWKRIGLLRAAVVLGTFGLLAVPTLRFMFAGRPGEPPIPWPLGARLAMGSILAFIAVPIIVSGGNLFTFPNAVRGAFRSARAARASTSLDGVRGLAQLFWVPLGMVVLLVYVRPMPNTSYFSVVLPGASLLAGWVLAAPSRRATRTLLLGLGFSLVASVLMVTLSAKFVTNWRATTEYVLERRRAGDAVFFYDTAGVNFFDYYATRVPDPQPGVPLPEVIFPEPGLIGSGHWEPKPDKLAPVLASHPRVWFVLFKTDKSELDPALFARCKTLEEANGAPTTEGGDVISTMMRRLSFDIIRCDTQ